VRKILIVFLVLFLALSLCSCEFSTDFYFPNSETTTETEVTSEKQSSFEKESENKTDYITYNIIEEKRDNFFRNFYENSWKYTIKCVKSKQLESTIGTYINGYFQGETLIWFEVISYGDGQTRYSEYYIIDHDLVYVKNCRYFVMDKRYEIYYDFYIVEGNYLGSNTAPVDFEIDNNSIENEIYEIAKFELLGNNDPIISETEIPPIKVNTLFYEMNVIKNNWFNRFYNEEKKYTSQSFDIESSSLSYSAGSIIALYHNESLYKISLHNPNETSFIRVDYYPISDDFIYVLVLRQEFENGNINFDDLHKSYYEEYFIIDGCVMKYDLEIQDLNAIENDLDLYTNYCVIVNSILK